MSSTMRRLIALLEMIKHSPIQRGDSVEYIYYGNEWKNGKVKRITYSIEQGFRYWIQPWTYHWTKPKGNRNPLWVYPDRGEDQQVRLIK